MYYTNLHVAIRMSIRLTLDTPQYNVEIVIKLGVTDVDSAYLSMPSMQRINRPEVECKVVNSSTWSEASTI